MRRDQCDETLGFVAAHPGCTAEEVGAEIYPWAEFHDGYRLQRPETTRRALTLLDGREVVRSREDGRERWSVVDPAS